MPIVRQYGIPDVEARPAPGAYPQVPAAGDVGLFGGNQARDQQIAGQNLDQTSNNVFGIYERMAREANDTKVEGDLNTFIAGKQKALSDFVQLKGEAAVQGSKAASDGLLKMKAELLGGAKNAYQREVLSRRLDAQLLDATGTITAHTANQATAWQVTTAAARSDLNGREAIMKRDDVNALDGLLAAAETLGQERARLLHGASPDSDVAKQMATEEKEKLLVGVIQAKITDGNKRAALALYDKYGNILKRNASVDAAMKGVRTEIDGENVTNAALAKVGLPQIRNGDTPAMGNLPPNIEMRRPLIEKAATTANIPAPLLAGVITQESGGRDDAVSPAGARGPAQLMPGTARDLGVTDPHDAGQAIPAGARYLRQQLDKFGDEKLALMAYNWGPGNVERWVKAGSDPSKVPAETRDYVGKVQGYAARFGTPGAPAYKGDLKAGYDLASADIQNRTDISPEVRSAALATLNKQSAAITSLQASSVKALKDEADAYRLNSYLSPQGADPAKMAGFADRAAALGEQSLASTYRVLAAVAPTATNGLQSMPADQLKMLKAMEEGPARKLLEGLESGRAEALTKANDMFSQVKKAQADGLDVAGLSDMAKQAAQFYAEAGKSEKAREVAQTYGAMVAAGNVMKGDPVGQKKAMAELEEIASKGQINEEQAALHGLLKDGIAKQAAEFEKDSFAAGRKLYGMPALPITDGAGRNEQAMLIAQRRGLRPDQIPRMTEEEFSVLRSQMGASPQAAQKVVAEIAMNYPPEAIPLIGAGIAGKGMADPVSMGYAAAISFAADREPDIAAAILDGVHKRKTMGDALRDMPKSDAFFSAVQTKMGNAFKSSNGGRVPALIVNAAEAIYTSKMVSLGRQGERSLDSTMFEAALDAVTGKPFPINGQMLVPPKGVESYQFSNALRQLENDNLVGLRTMNGSPVTADKMARYGMFSNAGKDGLYFVEMEDPAAGGKPAYVQGPDGQPFMVDIKPLLERAKSAPMLLPNESAARAERRRAPASPTAGIEP